MRRYRRRPSRLPLPWLLIGPSLVLAVVVIGYPFFEIIWLSLHDVSPFGVVRGFTGLRNYVRTFTDPIFIGAVLRTLEWTAAVVGGTVVISMVVALVLLEDFHGRGLARTIVMLPWSISLAMAAIVWLWSFNGNYGMVNAILRQGGLIS
ncbi:MAG: carbohydrate ABC transporter permease, partial [Acetobacteraceae bacterium]